MKCYAPLLSVLVVVLVEQGIISILKKMFHKDWDSNDRSSVMFITVPLLFVIMFAGTVLAPTKEIVTKRHLYALKDTTSIDCRVYLAGAKVEDEYVYRYMLNTPKGKKVYEAKGEKSYIKETKGIPVVEFHHVEYEKEIFNWILLPASINSDYTVFRVPSQSIANVYDIDLE